jgi:hypothetical protein
MEKCLPKEFKRYFWDVDLEKVFLDKHAAFIIERLLEYGDLSELEWVNKNYSPEVIVETVKKSRRISPKTGNFYAIYYGIPKEDLICMKKRLF